MKRYLITNPRFNGEVVAIFNDGVLQKLDFAATSMKAPAISVFKNSMPVFEVELQKKFGADTNIIESDFNITFQQFWKKYDHKFNANRCEALWDKMSKADKILAYFGLDKYHRYLYKNIGMIKLHPDTYLRNKAWLNEYK